MSENERERDAPPRLKPPDGISDVKGPSGISEMFFTVEDHPTEHPIVFHHIEKTAGTALRQFIRSALPSSQCWKHRPEDLSPRGRKRLLSWYRDWYGSLTDRQREELCCVMAHTANYLLPAMDRPVCAISLVREPVDRVLSYYYFHMQPGRRTMKVLRDRHDAASRAPNGGTQDDEPAVNRVLRELYATMGGRRLRDLQSPYGAAHFFNGQSRSLLAPHYDTRRLSLSTGRSPEAERWRERLFELVERTYTLGVSEHFDEFVQRLARDFGCDPWSPRAKVNTRRPAQPEVSSDTRETILAYNWLDAELHARVSARFGD